VKSYRDIAGDGGSNVDAQVRAQRDRLAARLASVRHVVAVGSGKGGVGKSSLTVHLSAAFALRGRAVGVLDADVNGSSIPALTGLRGRTPVRGTTGLVPPRTSWNAAVVSIDLFLQDDRSPVLWNAPASRDAYTWRAMMEMGSLREFLSDTEWGTLDILFVDLPPGTDKLPNLVDLVPRLSGTVLVTTPSGVSAFVVGKSVRMARRVLGTPVIGLVENMARHACPQCGREEPLFPGGDAERLARDEGVPFLGSIPFDSRLSAPAALGPPFVIRDADTPAARAILGVADRIWTTLEGGTR
jgi:ATP-binding protein involved in chromosome partitioning